MRWRPLHHDSNDERRSYWENEGPESPSRCFLLLSRFLASLDPCGPVLDVGCGTGRVLKELVSSGYSGNIHGIDWSLPSITRAQLSVPQAQYCVADCLSLPFPSETFAGCTMSALLTCFADYQQLRQLLFEVHRITKPGGVIFISDFLLHISMRNLLRYAIGVLCGADFGCFRAGTEFRHFVKQRLFRLLQESGFRVAHFRVQKTSSWHGKEQMGIAVLCIRNP